MTAEQTRGEISLHIIREWSDDELTEWLEMWIDERVEAALHPLHKATTAWVWPLGGERSAGRWVTQEEIDDMFVDNHTLPQQPRLF